MSRRAVVFGASGQLGVELVRELKVRRYDVTGWERTQVDITDASAVERALSQSDADVVFNSAAYNQVDIAEKEPQAAFLVNGLAVRNLALACRQMDARLVHFSPTYAPLLAARTIDLVDRDLNGVFHIGGGTPISWFQFARTIFQVAHLEPLLLATNEREYRTAARRPKYSALSNAKIERLGLDPLPPLQQAVGNRGGVRRGAYRADD